MVDLFRIWGLVSLACDASCFFDDIWDVILLLDIGTVILITTIIIVNGGGGGGGGDGEHSIRCFVVDSLWNCVVLLFILFSERKKINALSLTTEYLLVRVRKDS